MKVKKLLKTLDKDVTIKIVEDAGMEDPEIPKSLTVYELYYGSVGDCEQVYMDDKIESIKVVREDALIIEVEFKAFR